MRPAPRTTANVNSKTSLFALLRLFVVSSVMRLYFFLVYAVDGVVGRLSSSFLQPEHHGRAASSDDQANMETRGPHTSYEETANRLAAQGGAKGYARTAERLAAHRTAAIPAAAQKNTGRDGATGYADLAARLAKQQKKAATIASKKTENKNKDASNKKTEDKNTEKENGCCNQR